MRNVILLAPPKMLLQNPAAKWLEAMGNGSVIFSCTSKRAELEAHFQGCIELVLFDNFNSNYFVEKWALEVARNIDAVNIIALAEIDLLRAARVRDRLGISNGDEARLEFFETNTR